MKETTKVIGAFTWLAIIWVIRIVVVCWFPALVAVLLFYAHSDQKTYENFNRCTVEAEGNLARDTLAATISGDRKTTGFLLVQVQDQTRQCMSALGYDLNSARCQMSPDDHLTSIDTYSCFSRDWKYTLAAQMK